MRPLAHLRTKKPGLREGDRAFLLPAVSQRVDLLLRLSCLSEALNPVGLASLITGGEDCHTIKRLYLY